MPPLSEFPDPFGAHQGSVFRHAGPASYTQMTTGPLAGGDTVDAGEAGLQFFDAVIAVGLSDSGVYRVEGVAPVGNPSTNNRAAHAPTWRLRWVVVSTGAEVAAAFNLSAQTVRLFAIGRY